MSEKLRPEQRRLWRRAYLVEFEGNNSSPEYSRQIADDVVAQWEERGAFDVETPLQNSLAWRIVADTLLADFPDAFNAIHDALTSEEAKRRELVTPQ